MKILANDGIAPSGKKLLEDYGYTVITETVPQDQLADAINNENYEVVLVRSATTIRKEVIDNCPNLKMIGRGGVGMDNIDVAYAESKGIYVFNTPAASSQSVAELVMAHLFGAVRFLDASNRAMPTEGAENFKGLKKAYAKGIELRGKTIGIIGFGRIGQAVASYALGCGMKVMASAPGLETTNVSIVIEGHGTVSVAIAPSTMEEVLKNSDFISMHTPALAKPIIGKAQFDLMKSGAILVNAARGGVVDENALIEALDNGKLAHACLDVFENEPKPRVDLLQHNKISLSPHIGAATVEAQDRIGTELAELIMAKKAELV
ncbi:3-phosphoglycerate dehydrogenase [bacterium]|nr:3-phosphoglycerate dehydrogenase [bacterium]